MSRRSAPARLPVVTGGVTVSADAAILAAGAIVRAVGPIQPLNTLPPTQTLVLEGFPSPVLARALSPNGRVHWARREKARKHVAEALRVTAVRAGWAPATTPVRMTFRFIRPTRGRIDIDNLSTGVTKAVLDSLVRGGWLVDDDSTHVVAVTAEAVYERGRRALVVVMEEAA